MKDENKNININIESIQIENLIITSESLKSLKSLDSLKDINIKTSYKKKTSKKKDIDFSKKIDHNIDKEDNDFEIPYVQPKRIKAKRNFDNKHIKEDGSG